MSDETNDLGQAIVLLPCPFCGSRGVFTKTVAGVRVECASRFNTCPMNMRTRHNASEQLAADAWNTRMNKEA